MKKICHCSIFIVFFFYCGCELNNTPEAPFGLICELLRQPSAAVITDPQPEFGWIVDDNRRGAKQSALQILVSSEQSLIEQDTGDIWDSGKIRSNQSINIEYGGKALQAYTEYWWKVRTWDNFDRGSPWSSPQKFITGRLEILPAESNWVESKKGEWFLENRQKSSYHKLKPVEIISKAKDHYFVDFGKAAFATLQITLTSKKDNDSVIVYLGEKKADDHTVFKNTGRSKIGLKKCVLQIQKGKKTYTIRLPRKISHSPNSQIIPEHMPEVTPFRYAEILNSPSEIGSDDIRQIALIYHFDDNASGFSSSNDNLNKVWELCKYTLKAAPFLALYADGNRERMPYEADSYIQQLGHYSVDREYSIARYTAQFLITNPSWPTEWHMHSIFMAWHDYLQTGNTEFLRKYYDDLKAKTLMALARSDGLISTRSEAVTDDFFKSIHYRGKNFRDIVDWPPGTPIGEKQAGNHGPMPEGERDGYIFLPVNTVVNAFHYHSLILMSRISSAIGKDVESRSFNAQAERVKKSVNDELFDKAKGIYVDGIGTDHSSLHANMFPLAFGIVPEEYIPQVIDFIKSRGMACSVYGAQYLLEALYDAGEEQYALDLITSDSKRSWMNMIRVGSTMTTEAWDEHYKPNLTWNHAWGAAPANIIARKLMGIEPLEPAYRLIQIKPQPGNLDYAKLKLLTIQGTVDCKWEREDDRFFLDVTIPANTRARIWIPCKSEDLINEGGNKIKESEYIHSIGKKDGFCGFDIVSGSYHFSGYWQN